MSASFSRIRWSCTTQWYHSVLIVWGDGPEPCDSCGRPVGQADAWVAFRNPFAPDGVRFECARCYNGLLKRVFELREMLWEQEGSSGPTTTTT